MRESLKGGFFRKIYQYGSAKNKQFLLEIYNKGLGNFWVFFDQSKIFIENEKKKVEQEPTNFCMFLRKQLDNARLREISQKESERIIEFLFETKEGIRKLIVELFGGGNLLILDGDNIILSAAHYEKYKARDILAKSEYKYPKMEYNFFELKLNSLKELFNKTSRENLVKCLAVDLGLGGFPVRFRALALGLRTVFATFFAICIALGLRNILRASASFLATSAILYTLLPTCHPFFP